MATDDIILDENLDGDSFSPEKYNLASTGQRLANYFIDLVCYYVIVIAISAAFIAGSGASMIESRSSLLLNGIFIVVFILYYTILEGATGRSIDKYATGTKVVTADGDKPDYMTAFKRSLSRIVPFEVFTAFSSSKRMWHDKWTDTYLIKTR